MADKHTIARPYARAIFRVAQADEALAATSASLAVAAAIMQDGSVAKFLANPALDDAARFEFLTGLFRDAEGAKSLFGGANEHGANVLKLLIAYGRVDVVPEISQHFEAMKADVENTVDVTIASATALSRAQQDAIGAALHDRLGREVRLTAVVDENLIAGAVIRAGDVVIDGSVRASLDGLANALVS